MKRQEAFTLIELLIVISLVALVGGALYSMFASAVDLMRRTSRSVVAEDVSIFLEKWDRDVANQVVFRGIPFEGMEDAVSFPASIGVGEEDSMDKGIGRVSFFFDKSHKTIERRQENLAQIYEEAEVDSRPVLKGVLRARFQYFVYDKIEEIFFWADEWNSLEKENAIPVAVQVKFECEAGEDRYEFERTTAIPIAESTR